MTNTEDGVLTSAPENSVSVPAVKGADREYLGANCQPRKKSFSGVSEESQPTLLPPFTTICGEKVLHIGQTTEGTWVITNYRLYIQGKATNFNIPLGLIDQVEGRDIFFMHVNCKDGRYIKCVFATTEILNDVVRKIQQAISFPKGIEDSFAFTYFESSERELSEEMKLQLGADSLSAEPCQSAGERFDAEVKRMEFNTQFAWRISKENASYELCSSYPANIIVPINIDKEKLEQVARFRSAKRFPAVVWRHRGNGAVICRCSQPEVGWFGWRSTEDEDLVQAIIQACGFDRSNNMGESHTVALESTSSGSPNSIPNGSIEYVPESNVKKLLILDARSYATAVANRARGGGCECLEYYPHCEINFMNLANIHSIRKSFINVRQLCALPADQAKEGIVSQLCEYARKLDPDALLRNWIPGIEIPNYLLSWYSQLDGCKWLQHMSGLMKAAVTVVTAIESDGRPVMVHCSDGWDRTPQIVSLAEILLDPYYRSLKGFQVLVEREWLDFGHKFGDRCGQGVGSDDGNERCPVFLQWLDCLHQLVRQFPTTFEFNLTFLVKLAQHTYSNLFGTFLCNTAKEREQHDISNKTHSVWRFLRSAANHEKFRNSLYIGAESVVWPSCEVRDLALWQQVYLGYENPPPPLTEVVNPSQESSPTPSVAADAETSERLASCKTLGTKTRSCEDLVNLSLSKGLLRKMSDSSLRGSFHGTEDLDATISQSKEDLLRIAVTEDPKVAKSSQPLKSFFIDSDNEDDAEPDSDGLSEPTRVNAHKRRINVKSIESSTDTLVAESGVLSDSRSPAHETRTESAVTSVPDTQIQAQASSGPPEVALLKKLNSECLNSSSLYYFGDENHGITKEELDQLATGFNLNMGLDPSSVNHCEVCATSRKLVKDIGIAHGGNIIVNGFGGGTGIPSSTSSGIGPSNSGSKCSGYNSPIHSRTPSTGIPATPCNEEVGGRAGDSQCPVGTGTEHKSAFDVDGLTSLHDEVQSRLSYIVTGFRSQIDVLQRELQLTRLALMKQVGHKCTHLAAAAALAAVDHQDDTVSLSDSLGSGVSAENQSVGHESNSSEISWEAVDVEDAPRPMLWHPDYAVSQCMGCNSTFWLGKRKHHCRSCGKIFCADCSDKFMQVPAEQLYRPVRVCRDCSQRLNQSSLDPTSEDESSSTDYYLKDSKRSSDPPKTSSSVPSCAGHLTSAVTQIQKSTAVVNVRNHATNKSSNKIRQIKPETTSPVFTNGNTSYHPVS